MSHHLDVLIIGTGLMAKEHSKVLKALGRGCSAVGRDHERTLQFTKETGIQAISGGIEAYFQNNSPPREAVVAVDLEQLSKVTQCCLDAGVARILVEKPGYLTLDQLEKTERIRVNKNADVFVAYNRRFYSSVQRCKEILETDGGPLSFHFDFTELAYRIEKLGKSAIALEHWFEANSTHVIDLAFFLGGEPAEIYGKTSKTLTWHSRGDIFVGHGLTLKGVPFSYHANWGAPGRWLVELRSRHHKLTLCPLEELRIQALGSFTETIIEPDLLDRKFKPGLYRQMVGFLSDQNRDQFVSLSEIWNRMRQLAEGMLGNR